MLPGQADESMAGCRWTEVALVLRGGDRTPEHFQILGLVERHDRVGAVAGMHEAYGRRGNRLRAAPASVSSATPRSAISVHGVRRADEPGDAVLDDLRAGRRRSTPRPAPRTPSLPAPRGRSSPARTAAGTDRRPTAVPTRSCCSPSERHVVARARAPRRGARCRSRSGPSPTSTNRARTRCADRGETPRHGDVDPLDRPEVRDVNDQGVVAVRRAQPRAQRRIRPPAVFSAVEKIRNDPDVVPDAERRDGVGLQALRDRGDAVRLLDGERDRRARTTGRCRPA